MHFVGGEYFDFVMVEACISRVIFVWVLDGAMAFFTLFLGTLAFFLLQTLLKGILDNGYG